MARITISFLARLLLAAPAAVTAINVAILNPDSVRRAAALVAEDLLSFYNGTAAGETPGILPYSEYFWWTGGIMWNTLLDYRARTGDVKYDDLISQGLLFQRGPNDDYLPLNFSAQIGNDDQAFWALAALEAEEIGFRDPPASEAQWLTMAKNVFESQSSTDRRAGGNCENGLRWQILPSNAGYNYINAASNVAYFNLGARLARLTGNETYLREAEDTYDLLVKLGLVTEDFDVYDGVNTPSCDRVNEARFSYNAGLLLQGVAALYNETREEVWRERVDGLTTRILEVFFKDGVLSEAACEPTLCTVDMSFLKGITHRALAATAELAPHTAVRIRSALRTSAKAAAVQCTGGDNNRMCGLYWLDSTWDNTVGAGNEASVLSALVSVLTRTAPVVPELPNNGTSGNETATDGDNTPLSAGTVAWAGTSVSLAAGALLLVGLLL
ncbi:glycoside hydrolase family 76 protein [Durotheca rogersii]|uniref:glycoside hydrolase family 76 protein n=1 Tax=Durotheca rogersii TaxID=419775 RepID=UPI00221E3F2E|nr:glycoside hydrolase family 76 protein [Durotheca rogersii]KAI5860003.1 glycoside hydrolase family 76 protein [Durotheca rogersii]